MRNRAAGRMRAGIGAVLALVAALAFAGGASAHAEPVRANPPIDGSVATPPSQVEIWFSEETTNAASIKVFGPDGVLVDLGDTKLDLQDPQRVHVTVDLLKNLGPGTYRVQWNSVSAADGDAANGEFTFTIGAGTPIAQASPAASPVVAAANAAAGNVTPAPTPKVIPEQFKTNAIDDRALAIAIGVGVVAAIGIFLFWRLLRPKNPVV